MSMKNFIVTGYEAQDIQDQKVSAKHLFRTIRGYCGHQSGGPLGEDTVVLQDDNGVRHLFHFESFFNRYDVLTLGRYLRPCRASVVV